MPENNHSYLPEHEQKIAGLKSWVIVLCVVIVIMVIILANPGGSGIPPWEYP